MTVSETLKQAQTSDPQRLRYRLAMQGFTDVRDQDLREVALGLRLAPAVCMVGVALGTLLTSPAILGILILLAIPGFLTPRSPLDVLYNRVIRRWVGGPSLPERRAPSRFACLVAALWLSAILAAFVADQFLLGFLLGAAMVAVAGLMTFGHYCVASHLYRKVRGWPAEEQP
ncbi:DUF4395 family protein [Halochromatium sp.]